jgi:hypothetical protein
MLIRIYPINLTSPRLPRMFLTIFAYIYDGKACSALVPGLDRGCVSKNPEARANHHEVGDEHDPRPHPVVSRRSLHLPQLPHACHS